MSKEVLYGIIGLVVGVLLTALVASNAVNNNMNGMMQMMGMRTQNNVAGNTMVSNIDRHFIEQMIPHHEDAITMAKLAQTKATRAEVKELSQNIIDSQGKEINQMKVWYKDWFGTDVPQGTQMMGQRGMMGNQSDITILEQAEDFDRTFIEEMIPHHQMAVVMATMLKNGTQKPEMKKLAGEIIEAQTSEINQMRQWLAAW